MPRQDFRRPEVWQRFSQKCKIGSCLESAKYRISLHNTCFSEFYFPVILIFGLHFVEIFSKYVQFNFNLRAKVDLDPIILRKLKHIQGDEGLFRLRNFTFVGYFYYLILLKLLHVSVTIGIHNVNYILKTTDPLSVE
jgi:hypothetical protein